MSSRSKEKMAAAFRKIFRSSQKIGNPEGAVAGGQGCSSGNGGSPARRLLRSHGYHRDAVTPAEVGDAPVVAVVAAAPASRKSVADLFKSKKGGGCCSGSGSTSSATDKQTGGGGVTGPHKTVRSRRLMKELREIERVQVRYPFWLRLFMDRDLPSCDPQQQQHRNDPIFTVELVNDNLFEWHVRLHRVDQESDLATDMRDMGIPYILLHLIFPDNFPFAPPFMRVISPRIEKGFVMEGGAICMELLTPRGWASAYTVEAVVMQFAASIVKGQGRIAKKHKGSKDFNRRSAEESFRSLVKTHEKYGWVTPPMADG
uniref:E2 ubiquitin-conjugating enzyme n=1 Tax=Timema bartmani TaxID=61472 RepID=A0A7R9EPE1_9NEOP|nr:unnamed protein product [Timema bartmani]